MTQGNEGWFAQDAASIQPGENITIYGSDQMPLATVSCPYSIWDERLSSTETKWMDAQTYARARLIAQAPALLNALQALYSAIDSSAELMPEVLEQARAAITKATT